MHVHICTLSKHAHRNSESYTVIPLQFKSDGVKKKKKKSAPHKQKNENTSSWSMSMDRRKAPPLLRWNKVVNVWKPELPAPKSRLISLFHNYSKKQNTMRPFRVKGCVAHGQASQGLAAQHGETAEVQHAVTKKLPRWYLRHCSSHGGPDEHVPWRVSRNCDGYIQQRLSALWWHTMTTAGGAVPSFTQQRIVGDFFWPGLMSRQFKETCNHILQII